MITAGARDFAQTVVEKGNDMALSITKNMGKGFLAFLKRPNVGEWHEFSRFVGKHFWAMFIRPLFLDELGMEIVNEGGNEVISDFTQKQLWTLFSSRHLRKHVGDKIVVPTNLTITFEVSTEEITIQFSVASINKARDMPGA